MLSTIKTMFPKAYSCRDKLNLFLENNIFKYENIGGGVVLALVCEYMVWLCSGANGLGLASWAC